MLLSFFFFLRVWLHFFVNVFNNTLLILRWCTGTQDYKAAALGKSMAKIAKHSLAIHLLMCALEKMEQIPRAISLKAVQTATQGDKQQI
jgi:uncharacterized protein YebE (UPF0316 family)